MKKLSSMSLDELGVLVLEISEAVRLKIPKTPLAKIQVEHCVKELSEVGDSLRDAFSRSN